MISKKVSKLYLIPLAVIFLINLVIPHYIFAQNAATLSNIKLVNTRDDLLTYFDVKNAFTPEMIQAANKGIPTTFSFYVVLYESSDSWWDKKIADIEVKATLKYNSLKKEFSVTRPWKESVTSTTGSFEEARTWMTKIDNLAIISLEKLVKGAKYQLRIKAELDKVTLPLSLHQIFLFVSFWDFKTDWYLVNFTY